MKNNFVTIFIFVYAVISKLLTSFYSILYDDSLIYQDGAVFYNVGRMIMSGKVLYKETFDHKTPYIHFIYGFASLLKEGHLGLYIIEVLLIFIILLFIYKTLKLFDYKYALMVTLLLSMFLNSQRFTQGFFKTETCALAALTPAIYLFAKFFISEAKRFKLLDMFIIGILAGFSFMVNIRAIVLFVPFALVAAYILIKNKEFINLILIIVVGLFGVFISTIPYLIYAIKTDSLSDFYHAVIYTNLAYNTTFSGSFIVRINELKNLFLGDAFFVLYAFYSLIAIFFIQFNKYLKVSIILSYLIGLYYVLFTGIGLIYYFVILVPYFVFGLILLIKIFEKYLRNLFILKESFDIKTILAGVLIILFSYAISFNDINMMNKNCIRRSEKLISIFKNNNIDVKESKLLGIGFQPMVYTILDIVPKYKYFYTPNLSYKLCPEPFKGQVDYVMKLDPDIIVNTVPFGYEGIVMKDNFSIQDCYRMRDCIRTNYKLLATYDMNKEWGTYQIYIKDVK